MTRLPMRSRLTSEQGLLFVENVRDNLSVITLSVLEQFEAVQGSPSVFTPGQSPEKGPRAPAAPLGR